MSHTIPDQDQDNLSLTVVKYTDTPDRCTLHPPDVSGDARLATWISADRDAFVSCSSMR
jgi:hypothetical protein